MIMVVRVDNFEKKEDCWLSYAIYLKPYYCVFFSVKTVCLLPVSVCSHLENINQVDIEAESGSLT